MVAWYLFLGHAPPGDHGHDDVGHELVGRGLHGDGAGPGAPEPGRHGARLGVARGGGGAQAVRAERVHGGEAAELAPERAVVAHADGGAVLGEQAPRVEPRAARQRDVVGGEALAGDGRGGDEDDRLGAEPEEEAGAGAVAGGQRGEAAVQRRLEEVEVAQDGERRRARDAPAMATTALAR